MSINLTPLELVALTLACVAQVGCIFTLFVVYTTEKAEAARRNK